MIVIETPRLTLREHRPSDLDPLHAMLSDPALIWYLPGMYMESLSATAGYLASVLRDQELSLRRRYNLAVVDRTGRLLGSVSLHVVDSVEDGAHYSLGYFIRPDCWNLGYATEAVQGAMDYFFSRNACRISASCLAENLASRRVLEKCGMRQEGLMKAHTWHDRQWKDCAIYARLKD